MGWKGWIDGIMEHIELFTMESYLETKKDVIENANYELKELHIGNEKRILEVMKEIWKEYFETENKVEQEKSLYINYRRKGSNYEVVISDTIYVSTDQLFVDLKIRYNQLMQEKKEKEVVEDIRCIFSNVFVYSCRLSSGYMNKVYEIIKYGFSKGMQCDYLDNGKFISEMNEDDIFPFEKVNGKLPIYCQNMQQVLFGVHRKIFINFDKRRQSFDITRFSFYNTKKIVNEVIEALRRKKKRENYELSYIEGMEDFILLDEILGISLTNIIYWKTKEIKKREVQDNIIEIIPYLAKCNSLIGRNLVTQVLLDCLKVVDYNVDIVREVGKILEREIKRWNEYYEEVEAVNLFTIFNYLLGCPKSNLVKVCIDIESENKWDEYMYMDEIIKDDEMMENKKVRIPVGDMDNRTWYAYIHRTIFEAIWN